MSLFQVHEHTVPCQHIRHYAHATLDSQEDILHLAVKQYTPLDNLHPGPGDLTIIGGHANAFPKVCGLSKFDGNSSLISSRNSTNHCGMNYSNFQRPLVSGFGTFG
jgi:hypothetical protein